MKILSYNTQRGKRGLEFTQRTINENQDADLFLFQRFPKDFLEKIESDFFSYFDLSFLNADNGCLCLSKKKLVVESIYSSVKIPKNPHQSFVVQKIIFGNFLIINTLPPYVEENIIEQKDYKEHLALCFSQGARLIIGDFHNEDKNISRSLIDPYFNHSKDPNFTNQNLQPMNLSKIYSPVELKSFHEKVIDFSAQPVTHSPIVYQFEVNN